MKLLEVKGLKTSFYTEEGEVEAVRGIDFEIKKGEILGLVGESGSGKSVTAKSIMGLIQNPGEIKSGSIKFQGKELIGLSQKEYNGINGKDIAMIFQDPLSSFNPLFTIGHQIGDVMNRHGKKTKNLKDRIIDQLRKVGIPSPKERIDSYPHEFSGGQRQRGMTAMSLSCSPDLIIADEPTTALDVTIQAQILNLLRNISLEEEKSILLITHDLGVVAEVCDRVIVMYGGHIMEEGSVFDLFDTPKHPYTKGLLNSIPSLESKTKYLKTIEGSAPSLINSPKGCPFAERCKVSMEKCHIDLPLFKSYGQQRARCWQLEESKCQK